MDSSAMTVITLAAPPPPPAPRLRRIGQVVAVGALACAVALVIGTAVVWSNDAMIRHAIVWPGPLGLGPVTLGFDTRLFGALLSLLGAAPALYALVQLSRLFSAFARGVVFEDENVARIRAIGIALLVKVALSPAIQVLTTLTLTINNPPGARSIALGIEMNHLLTILGGLALIAFASVMREAVRVARENHEFV
jgi:hypothetical protein